jgi:hypothetical protein
LSLFEGGTTVFIGFVIRSLGDHGEQAKGEKSPSKSGIQEDFGHGWDGIRGRWSSKIGYFG